MSNKHQSKKPEPEKETADNRIQAESVPEETPENENVEEAENEIDVLNKEVESLQSQLAQSKNDLLRAYADTDNLRKRLLKETENVKKYRFQDAAAQLLPVLDNLNRALEAVPANEEAANFVRGFEMIQTQLVNVLHNEGVQEIEALNQPFDANYMQALATEKKEGVEPGIVTEVMQKGYTLKDRLLRPALVKVSE